MKLISRRECTVSSLGSPSLKLFMKPQTPTVTGRAVTSSWRAMVGCVTQGRQTLCQLKKLGGYWIRPVYISITLCMCFIVFFNNFMTVLIDSSLCFLQYDGALKLISRSTTFSKFFLQSLNQRNGRGLSL